jgi:hypothetical protein
MLKSNTQEEYKLSYDIAMDVPMTQSKQASILRRFVRTPNITQDISYI